MTFLRTRRSFSERFESVKKAGIAFAPKAPTLYDDSRTQSGVTIGKGGRMKSVNVFYKKQPKELGLDFLTSPASKVVKKLP
ncbi:MAG TPA: hypothetical protein VFM18_00610 [Methanosarcina sp.]|nr:hypothetical protein [Methanosarcina sp.]